MNGIIQKHNYVRSKAYTDAAKDQPCAICQRNDGTTVFCHLNKSWAGKGKGIKADDFAGFDGCYACHLHYDEPRSEPFSDLTILRAMYRTIKNRIERDIIIVKGPKP